MGPRARFAFSKAPLVLPLALAWLSPSQAMAQPTMEINQQPSRRDSRSPTGFILTGYEKGILLCLLLGVLYLRLYKRKRKKDKICSHCGTRNPSHQTNCKQCSAPLFNK
ncbi:MAG TPA: hypothetical protein VK188_12485 [Holophaga sp.]|nr:hypothetical protein [Holophaga sp.]